MLNLKKIGVLGIASFALLPIARADISLSIENLKVDGKTAKYSNNISTSDMVNYSEFISIHDSGVYYNVSNKVTFTIEGTDFDSDINYQIVIDNLYNKYDETKTGAEINNGIDIALEDAKATYTLNIKNLTTNEKVTWLKSSTTISSILIQVDDQGINDEFDSAFNEAFPNNEITIDMIEPPIISMLMEDVFKNYMPKVDGYSVKLNFESETFDSEIIGYYVTITRNAFPPVSKNYPIKVNFKSKVNVIADLLKTFHQKLTSLTSDFKANYDKRFIIEDLDTINYYYSTKDLDEEAASLSMSNYSRKLHEFAGDANVDFMFIPGMGGDVSDFTEQIIGPVNIYYKGELYDAVDPIGFNLTNVIYIPSDTDKSDEAFIEAAKKRIKEYLDDAEIEISVGGTISDLDEHQNVWESDDGENTTEYPLVDVTKTCGKWFELTIGEKTYSYFIVADSDKMTKPFVKTKDLNTNVYIITDASDVPLDASIRVEKISEESDEYKALAKKLNLVKGMVYDLDLFSSSKDMYIRKTEDGKFKVYIPVEEELTKKKLVAVYTKEDGSTEEYAIKFEKDGDKYYAVFETDHFSTYAIVDKGNPKTGDKIILYISILVLSSVYLLYRKCKKVIK